MSLFPVYEYLVRGPAEQGDYSLFDKRSLRATSTLPDSVYLRGYTSVPKTLTQRSVSVARDVVALPDPFKSRQYSAYLDARESLDRTSYLSRLSEDRTGYYSYVSPRGYSIPLYRRKLPSSYWISAASPYSSYRYNSTPEGEDYSGNYYGRKDYYPFVSSATVSHGLSRIPWRDWRTESPYRSFSSYRPRYISPTVRSSYLYPKYV